MPHTVTFFPTGNADTCLIGLQNGRVIIYDYADTRDPADKNDRRIDLKQDVLSRVGAGGSVSVLAFSHLDRDHYQRATELFWLAHAKKYQDDARIKVDVLWVPAAAILEEGIEDEGRVLRAEARHRLKEGKGIRVFSAPNAIDAWLKEQGIDPAARAHLITDAGQMPPEFSLAQDEIEFFVHSPFAERCEDGSLVERNASALFMQATFSVSGELSRLMLSADCEFEVLEQIVRVTRFHKNEDRLLADINNLPHHCSYLSLAAEKGKEITTPSADLQWLYEHQSNSGCLLVSTSHPIPGDDTVQPPHRQAANYYRSVAQKVDGEFIVSMEHPKVAAPEPLEIEITSSGPKVKKKLAPAAAIITSTHAPRAGAR